MIAYSYMLCHIFADCNGGFSYTSKSNGAKILKVGGNNKVGLVKGKPDNFYQVPGLNGESGTVSLQSQNKPNSYLR